MGALVSRKMRRIGPVGTVTGLGFADTEWNPTVGEGKYAANPTVPELGRRILVSWESAGMPPGGKVAVVPSGMRPVRPLARHTIEELPRDQFEKLCAVLQDVANWVDIVPTIDQPDVPDAIVRPAPPPSSGISVLERDLQKFLSRNLHLIEPGLVPHPEYQLEEYQTDVGRIDILCRDSAGAANATAPYPTTHCPRLSGWASAFSCGRLNRQSHDRYLI